MARITMMETRFISKTMRPSLWYTSMLPALMVGRPHQSRLLLLLDQLLPSQLLLRDPMSADMDSVVVHLGLDLPLVSPHTLARPRTSGTLSVCSDLALL